MQEHTVAGGAADKQLRKASAAALSAHSLSVDCRLPGLDLPQPPRSIGRCVGVAFGQSSAGGRGGSADQRYGPASRQSQAASCRHQAPNLPVKGRTKAEQDVRQRVSRIPCQRLDAAACTGRLLLAAAAAHNVTDMWVHIRIQPWLWRSLVKRRVVQELVCMHGPQLTDPPPAHLVAVANAATMPGGTPALARVPAEPNSVRVTSSLRAKRSAAAKPSPDATQQAVERLLDGWRCGKHIV